MEDLYKQTEDDILKLLQLGYIEILVDEDENVYFKATEKGVNAYMNEEYLRRGKLN